MTTDGHRRRKPVSEEAALTRMAALCASQEMSRSQIMSRLLRMGLDSCAAGRVATYLEKHRFIDNSRFAAAFARDKVKFSRWGKAKIKAALMQKGIDSQTISEAISSIDDRSYAEAAAKAAAAKAGSLDLSSYADRAKLYRSLAARGFGSDAIAEAIAALRASREDNT